MHIKNKRGQSTVEYILLVTAVVAIMIVFATNQNNGLQGQLNTTLSRASNAIGSEMDQLDSSRAISNAAGNSAPSYKVNINPS